MHQTISIPRGGVRAIGILLIALGLTACGGGHNDPPPRIENPPPETDLVWGQGNWDELNWQ